MDTDDEILSCVRCGKLKNDNCSCWNGVGCSELLALRIQSLIADKAMVTANANRNISEYGEWQVNYNEEYGRIDCQIDALFSSAKPKIARAESLLHI